MQTNKLNDLYSKIENYIPYNEQEARDQAIMLHYITASEDVLTRKNEVSHFTASSWIINSTKDKVLMIYHNIYDSWAWTGGHADGEEDLLNVAIREAKEETGLTTVTPVIDGIFSLETLVVNGHIKRNNYVASHLHMNVTYLLQADETETLCIKEDENSGVKWFTLEEAINASSEPWIRENIYKKLNNKLMSL